MEGGSNNWARHGAKALASRTGPLIAAVAVIAAALLFSACGGGESTAPAAVDAATTRFDPANFEANPARGANPYLPLVPGCRAFARARPWSAGARCPTR